MIDRAQLELDVILRRIAGAARLLPALTARSGVQERQRLIADLLAGRRPVAEFKVDRRPTTPDALRWVDEARRRATRCPAPTLYLARLEELELELAMIDALGDARRMRPMAGRRFGTGAEHIEVGDASVPLVRVAASILETVPDDRETPTVPASGPKGARTLEAMVYAVAMAAGIEVRVQVEPLLVANAAAGDRVVFIAERSFGSRESRRLAIHEVLGHLVSAANGRAQPLKLLEIGTAGSFADQEGLAIFLEERAGLLDGRRVRTFAARVWATDAMHRGASFGEVAMLLVQDHGFDAVAAVAIAERAFRGGGVARDAVYLRGWLRVRGAVGRGDVAVDELRLGKVSVDDVVELRDLMEQGWVRSPCYTPNLARCLEATAFGVPLEKSPPNLTTSLTPFDGT